jgi:hypothetical protein
MAANTPQASPNEIKSQKGDSLPDGLENNMQYTGVIQPNVKGFLVWDEN